MSRTILSTLLLAAAVSAQSSAITTSFWWPGTGDDAVPYTADVLGVSGGKTTIAVNCDSDDENCDFNEPNTMVVGGSTYWQSTTYMPSDDDYGEMTMSAQCTQGQSDKKPTCTISSGGLGALQEYCSDYTDYASYYTDVSSSYSGVPDFCSGSTLPEDVAVTTTQLPANYIAYHTVTVTSGAAKLLATAADASTTNGPSSTTMSTAKQTGSGSAQSSQATTTGSSTGTATGSSAPEQHTGAAAHLAAPMAGIAAVAMAAFAL